MNNYFHKVCKSLLMLVTVALSTSSMASDLSNYTVENDPFFSQAALTYQAEQTIREYPPIENHEILISEMSFGKTDAKIVYNSKNNEYLSIYTIDRDIYAKRMADNGQELSSSRLTSNPVNTYVSEFNIAYNPDDNNYLVVWTQPGYNSSWTSRISSIVTQRLDANGIPDTRQYVLQHPLVTINPEVVYNPVAKKFLIVRVQLNNDSVTDSDIIGQFISPRGIPYPHYFPITTWSHQVFEPSVAVNTQTGEFVVSWDDNLHKDNLYKFAFYIQRLNANGILQGGHIPVSNVDDIYKSKGDITYNSINNQYFIVWYEDGTIKGRILGNNGIPTSSLLHLPTNSFADWSPNAVFNSKLNEYFVVSMGSYPYADISTSFITMNRISAQGISLDTYSTLTYMEFNSDNFFSDSMPDVTYNTLEDDYFVTWDRYYQLHLSGSDSRAAHRAVGMLLDGDTTLR